MSVAQILVVEDDRTTQELTRTVLEAAGYGVRLADSAEDAAEYLLTAVPDVVLMDRDLPGMDGLELTRRLRKSDQLSNTIVLAFSSHNTPLDNAAALDAGADGSIAKPFDTITFLERIALHIANRALRGTRGPIAKVS
jgi:DNA-binding response OmpR family regulator